jgi:hypothetical protein
MPFLSTAQEWGNLLMKNKAEIGEEQSKQLEPVLTKLGRAFDELSEKLREMNIDPDGGEDFYRCNEPGCHCTHFVPKSENRYVCRVPQCNHHFFKHLPQ